MGRASSIAAVLSVLLVCAPERSAPAESDSPAPAASSPEPTRDQCVSLHESAQTLRQQGKLLDARHALRQCSATACPSLVRSDCVDWLDEIERRIPSVIFYGSKNGEDVVELRVSDGDQAVTEKLGGVPFELDPGPHHFSAELGGVPPLPATYVLQEGE